MPWHDCALCEKGREYFVAQKPPDSAKKFEPIDRNCGKCAFNLWCDAKKILVDFAFADRLLLRIRKYGIPSNICWKPPFFVGTA
jgi:hypothetical protein